EEFGHDLRAVGLLDGSAIAPMEVTPHEKPGAFAWSPADELQAVEARKRAGELRAGNGEGGEDLGEGPIILDQPENGEELLVRGKRRLLLHRELRRCRRAFARKARELLQVEIDHLENLLDALERKAAVRKHALHGGFRHAQ